MMDENFEHTTEASAPAESSVASRPTDLAEVVGGSADRINEIYAQSLRDLNGSTVSLAEVNSFLEATAAARRMDVREMEKEGRGREIIEEAERITDGIEAARNGLLTEKLTGEEYDSLKDVASKTAGVTRDRGLNPEGLGKFVESASSFVK